MNEISSFFFPLFDWKLIIFFLKVSPERYIECFIAEQNLVGVAIGAGCRNRTIPYVSTFAAFFTRAFDQLRMGAISQTNITCVGSHAGVSIGEDGPSQMALEDIAMFRSIPGTANPSIHSIQLINPSIHSIQPINPFNPDDLSIHPSIQSS